MSSTYTIGLQSSEQLRTKNVWYTSKDGNWSDPTTWMSNGINSPRNGKGYPNLATDDVILNHAVLFNTGGNAIINCISINSLTINPLGKLTNDFQPRLLYISNGLRMDGTLDCRGTGDFTIGLAAPINSMNGTFYVGTSRIIYSRFGNQAIMPITYYNLDIQVPDTNDLLTYGGQNIGSGGLKYLTGDIVVNNNFFLGNVGAQPVNLGTAQPYFEAGSYNVTVYGGFFHNTGIFSKSGAGNLLFGTYTSEQSTTDHTTQWTGNPNVEFRGNASFRTVGASSNWGSGVFTWTSNGYMYGADTGAGMLFNGGIRITNGVTLSTYGLISLLVAVL
jgi:hypothetical protein